MGRQSWILRWSPLPLRVLGVVVLAAGTYLGIYQGIIEPLRPGHHFLRGDLLQLAAGLVLILLGLMSVVLGEAVTRLLAPPDAPDSKES